MHVLHMMFMYSELQLGNSVIIHEGCLYTILHVRGIEFAMNSAGHAPSAWLSRALVSSDKFIIFDCIAVLQTVNCFERPHLLCCCGSAR